MVQPQRVPDRHVLLEKALLLRFHGHGVALEHHAVRGADEVLKRLFERLVADARRAEGDAAHVGSGELAGGPARAERGERAADAEAGAGDAARDIALHEVQCGV